MIFQTIFGKHELVKSVRIWSFSGLCFPAFRLNTEIFSVISVFSTKVGKYGPEKLRIRTLSTVWYIVHLETKFTGEQGIPYHTKKPYSKWGWITTLQGSLRSRNSDFIFSNEIMLYSFSITCIIIYHQLYFVIRGPSIIRNKEIKLRIMRTTWFLYMNFSSSLNKNQRKLL